MGSGRGKLACVLKHSCWHPTDSVLICKCQFVRMAVNIDTSSGTVVDVAEAGGAEEDKDTVAAAVSN